MDCHCIKQSALPHSTRLFSDYLYHFERVRPFYSLDPFDGQSFSAAARTLDYPRERRNAVADVLAEQAQRFGASETARRNLERFRSGAAALVTGQQVGLLGGPLFAVYKALTAARLADALSAQGLDCVPVFWLATEDHDLAEINHAFLLGRDYGLHRIEDPGEQPIAGAPVGEVRLSAAIAEQLESVIVSLPQSEASAAVAATARECYRPGTTFGEAFGRFMAALLSRYGVILLDPTHPALRRIASGVLRGAIESSDELQRALADRNKQLMKAGYHGQVHLSEASTLFFVSRDGRRTPVRRRNNEFLAGDNRHSRADLLKQLEQRPEDFSPNVLLRPVVQDALLPTVAYVGGPAEVAYMAQASVLYEQLLGRMPVIFPRASFTLLDGRAAKLLARYNVTVPDVLSGSQKLRQKMAPELLAGELADAFSHYESTLEQLLAGLQTRVGDADSTLAGAAATSARKMRYQLSKIKGKAGRAAGRRSGQLESDAELLENLIHPRKSLQERVYSAVSFLALFGPSLFERLYERISPATKDPQVLAL